MCWLKSLSNGLKIIYLIQTFTTTCPLQLQLINYITRKKVSISIIYVPCWKSKENECYTRSMWSLLRVDSRLHGWQKKYVPIFKPKYRPFSPEFDLANYTYFCRVCTDMNDTTGVTCGQRTDTSSGAIEITTILAGFLCCFFVCCKCSLFSAMVLPVNFWLVSFYVLLIYILPFSCKKLCFHLTNMALCN